MRINWTGRSRRVQALGDVEHHFGAVAAEEDDRGRQSRLQAKLCSEGEWIGVVWDVEIGAQDHAGGGEDVGVIVTDGAGLLDGSLGSGD